MMTDSSPSFSQCRTQLNGKDLGEGSENHTPPSHRRPPKKFSGGDILENKLRCVYPGFQSSSLGWLICSLFPLLSAFKSGLKVALNTS